MIIKIDKIKPNPDNARKYFDKISELAEDIKKKGLIQKISVRPLKNGYYEIIQGERRFRALKLLGRNNLDAEVISISRAKANKISLAENIQREDLSIIELAKEFEKRLKNQNQQKLAKNINKSQGYVSQTLQVLKLPKSIHRYFLKKELNKEHARELLQLQKYLIKVFGCDAWFVEHQLTDFAWVAFIKKWDAPQLYEAVIGHLTAFLIGDFFKKGDTINTWRGQSIKYQGKGIEIPPKKINQNKYSVELIEKILTGNKGESEQEEDAQLNKSGSGRNFKK